MCLWAGTALAVKRLQVRGLRLLFLFLGHFDGRGDGTMAHEHDDVTPDEGFIFHLQVCDGRMRTFDLQLDEALAGVAFAHEMHEQGLSVWLWDDEDEEMVAASTAACLMCANAARCPDELPRVMSDEEQEAFWRRVLGRVGIVGAV